MKRFLFALLIITASLSVYSQLSYKPLSILANDNEQLSINSKYERKLLGIDGVTNKTRPRQGGLQKYSLIGIGAKGGANLCFTNGEWDYTKGNDFLIAYNGGIFINIFHEEMISFQAELLYNQNGFKNTWTNTTLSIGADGIQHLYKYEKNDLSIRFHNIMLPLFAKFKFGNDVAFYFDLGAYAAYSLMTQCVGTVTTHSEIYTGEPVVSSTPLVQEINFDISDSYKTYDVGAIADMGIKIRLGLNRYRFFPSLLIEARYYYPIFSYLDSFDTYVAAVKPGDPPVKSTIKPKSQLNTISLNIGILLPL